MKGSRSKGTEAEPACSCCDKTGHYASACPVLAKQVLAALGKTHSSAQIKKIVAKNTSLKLQDFHGKNVKTGKRASGNRSFRGPVASAAGAASKAKKGRGATKKNKERERTEVKTSRSETKGQTAQSRSSFCGWRICKPGLCECGGTWSVISFAHCQQRGFGRKFLRCEDCL